MAPLVSPVTYRRGVHLLLGAVLLLPYLGWAAAAARTLRADGSRAALPLLLLLLGVGGAVAFLGVTRALEIVAARFLLDAGLTLPRSGRPERLAWEARVRSALWFALHLVTGGVVGALLVVGVPLLLAFAWWLVPVYAVGVGYAVAGLGALVAAMAPVLLGPSAAELITASEENARRLAERNRIARELHDSIGHALTATTLQAAAARQVFDADPEFVRRALEHIEEAGRAAADDLDHVLGVLRGDVPAERADADGSAPGLGDLDRLCATVRAGGVELTWEVAGPVAALPAAVSQEGYRIVQEGLTNVARHAGPGPVTLAVTVSAGALRIELRNPPADPALRTPGGGRGLAGIRERITLLGGSVEHGVSGGVWRLAVGLPIGADR